MIRRSPDELVTGGDWRGQETRVSIKARQDTLGLGCASVVAFVAAGVRLLHFLALRNEPWWGALQGDSSGYYEWATRITAGALVGAEGFYQAPLYPYILAVIRLGFGDGIWPIAIVQFIAGTSAAILVAAAASRLWGRSVGVIAGLMMAGYAPGVFFDGVVQKASFAGLATSGLIAATYWAVLDSRRRAILVMGVMCGLVCLLREQVLVWIPRTIRVSTTPSLT